MTSNELIRVQQMFIEFNEKLATKEIRMKLSATIKKVIKEYGFVRKDNDNVIELKLHPEPSLSPELSIGLTTDNKIWICDDSLWRTIEGIYENEQERRTY